MLTWKDIFTSAKCRREKATNRGRPENLNQEQLVIVAKRNNAGVNVP